MINFNKKILIASELITENLNIIFNKDQIPQFLSFFVYLILVNIPILLERN